MTHPLAPLPQYVKTEAEAACVALVNGTTDVCSGVPYHSALMSCPHDAINAALFRTFKLRFQLGLFDPIANQPYWNTPLSAVDTPASRALNAQATRESMVLLKNVGGFLPLAPGKTIAVIGPHALAQAALVGNCAWELAWGVVVERWGWELAGRRRICGLSLSFCCLLLTLALHPLHHHASPPSPC